jgi:hypothetical protein
MNAKADIKTRFFEGGNVATVILLPVLFILSLVFYPSLEHTIQPLQIKVEDLYTYIFNLFAIELGALLALFALFACKPTPFLERIKNTATFASIVANTKITMLLVVIALVVTLALGLVRFEPDEQITIHSLVFLGWCWLVMATTAIYVRTVRLIFTALA